MGRGSHVSPVHPWTGPFGNERWQRSLSSLRFAQGLGAIVLLIGGLMRTSIEIDDELMQQAMRSSGARTKKAVVEAALQLLVRTHSQTGIRRLRGKVRWQGDLNKSRRGRI
jgi:Arc/MetJ family transcription regulator